MARRARRNGFGCVISTGTATHPAFAIRWWEGSRRKKKSGFKTRTAASEALARVRTGLGDGTLVEKRKAGIGFDEVARQWLALHSKPNLRSHDDNEERYRLHVAPVLSDAPLGAITATRILDLGAGRTRALFSLRQTPMASLTSTTATHSAPPPRPSGGNLEGKCDGR